MGEGDRVIKVMGEGEVVNVNVLLGPWETFGAVGCEVGP